MLVLVNLFSSRTKYKVRKYADSNFRNFVRGLDGEGKERGCYFSENRGSKGDIFSKQENLSSFYSRVQNLLERKSLKYLRVSE